jgi:hypothetical protein
MCSIFINECNLENDVAYTTNTIQIQHGVAHIFEASGSYIITIPLTKLHLLWKQYHLALNWLRARDHDTLSTLIGGKGWAGPSSLHTTLEGPMDMWMQDGCKVYMDSYMTSIGSRFMVTWTILKNRLLKVGLMRN